MPVRVRVEVEDHEAALAAVDDQVRLVVILAGLRAEDALLLHVLGRVLHVGEAPGRPDPLAGHTADPREGDGSDLPEGSSGPAPGALARSLRGRRLVRAAAATRRSRDGDRARAHAHRRWGGPRDLPSRVVDGEPADGYETVRWQPAADRPCARAAGADVDGAGRATSSSRAWRRLSGSSRTWCDPDARPGRDATPAASARGTAGPSARDRRASSARGLDSFYSVRHGTWSASTRSIFMHGFDVRLEDARESRERVAGLARRAAGAWSLELVEVETGRIATIAQALLRGGASSTTARCSRSIGLAARAGFRDASCIPGSAPATLLHPWGSHPDLDPLWGSDAVEFVHDGAVTGARSWSCSSDSRRHAREPPRVLPAGRRSGELRRVREVPARQWSA